MGKLGTYISNQIKTTRNTFRDPIIATVAVAMVLALFVFVVWPLLMVVKQSFTDLDGNFSLQAYINIVTMSETYQALVNTLMLAIIVGVLATSVGFLFAYCSSHLAIKGKKLFNLMALLPMVSPPFSVALSIIMLFGSRGLVTYSLLGWSNTNIYGLKGLIFVQTISYFPIAFLLLAGMLQSIDPSIEDAARDLGSSKWRTFSSVTIPLVRPGIANAFLLVFIKSVADFANPMAIGGNFSTLATQVYLQAIGSYDVQGGAAVAVVLLDIAIILFILSKYWIEKKTYITVTGKASRERTMIGDPQIVGLVGGFCFLVTAIVLAIYILIPIASFIKMWGVDYSFTTAHYKYALEVGMDAIKDTTLLSIIATPIRYGVEKSIMAWAGPEGKSKDFAIDDCWYEIKTIGANTSKVHISSMSQLSSDKPGRLVVIKVEAFADQYDGDYSCVADLFNKIKDEIKDEAIENVFYSRFSLTGIVQSDEAMNLKFKSKEQFHYIVDEAFPKITESTKPYPEICDAEYDLSLNALDKYLER